MGMRGLQRVVASVADRERVRFLVSDIVTAGAEKDGATVIDGRAEWQSVLNDLDGHVVCLVAGAR